MRVWSLNIIVLACIIGINIQGWTGHVLPVSYDQKANQWNVLLGFNPNTGQWEDFWASPLGHESKASQTAERALKYQTNQHYQVSLQGAPWFHDKNAQQFIHFVVVPYISGKTLYQTAQNKFRTDFAWMPVVDIFAGAKTSHKNSAISQRTLSFILQFWDQAVPQLAGQKKSSISLAQEPISQTAQVMALPSQQPTTLNLPWWKRWYYVAKNWFLSWFVAKKVQHKIQQLQVQQDVAQPMVQFPQQSQLITSLTPLHIQQQPYPYTRIAARQICQVPMCPVPWGDGDQAHEYFYDDKIHQGNEYLGNFYPAFVTLDIAGDQITFICAEAAFQAGKFLTVQANQIVDYNRNLIKQLQTADGDAAFRIAQKNKSNITTPNWSPGNFNVAWMLYVVRSKFIQNPHLQQMLLATQNKELVEHSHRDAFWGVYDFKTQKWGGKQGNQLGKILMHVREELRTGNQKPYQP